MKSQFILLLLVSVLVASCSGTGSSASYETELDSVCYVLGHSNGKGMLDTKEEFPGGGINVAEFVEGFISGIDSVDSKLLVDDVQTFLNTYFQEAQGKDQERAAALAADSTLDLPKFVSPSVDSASYVYGHMIGSRYREGAAEFPGGEMNIEAIKAGFKDGTAGDEPFIVVGDDKVFLNNYFQRAQAADAAKAAEQAEKEAAPKLAEVAKFMEENGKRDGVITDDSGMFQYEVIKKGKGPKPVATDKVKVHYHGTFIDGTVFDSSVERGEPATFGLNQVIRGWTEGLQLMPVGSKYKFYIHPEYAYGIQGRPGIPAASLLIFDVELLSIEK